LIDIGKFLKSLKYALAGIVTLVKTENNARIHLLATVLVVSLCLYLKLTPNAWLWVSLAIALVWITEAINTSIEATVDLASPQAHKLAKKAKDIAAAAVIIAAAFALVVAYIQIIPLLW
jgi:diacylglycerol kinase